MNVDGTLTEKGISTLISRLMTCSRQEKPPLKKFILCYWIKALSLTNEYIKVHNNLPLPFMSISISSFAQPKQAERMDVLEKKLGRTFGVCARPETKKSTGRTVRCFDPGSF